MGESSNNRTRPAKQTKKTRKRKRNWRAKAVFTFLFVLLFAIIGIASAASVAYYAQADVSELATTERLPTVIYDRYGDAYAELSNSRIDFVELTQIPEHLQQAIIAIEDSRFRDHPGIDVIGIGRALVQNARTMDIAQGGSTITQQLAKNRFLTAEQTLIRKWKEAILAIKIERTYSKDQILEQYLNSIYFGEGAWGIQNAANIYFGKDVAELSLAESALIAGLPKAPSHYSPVKDMDKAVARRNIVLGQMHKYGMIDDDSLTRARSEQVVLATPPSDDPVTRFSSYTDHVIEETIAKTGLSEQDIMSGGLQIHTWLDPQAQAAAEEVYRMPEQFPEDAEGLQSGFVLLDSTSGGIRAMVGQLGEKHHYRGFNYATQTRRQPGSSIKPIVAFAPALEAGFRPHDRIYDVETDFNGYKPSNYGRRFHGWVTLEESLVQSYNVPAVALLREIGIDNGMALALESGLPLTDEDRTLAVALGGLNRGVSPLHMAQAYTMFAAGGVWSEAHAIYEIYDAGGRRLYRAQPEQKQLISPETAYEMTRMMEQVVQRGTGTQARMERSVAGKTGTTQLPDTPQFRDANGQVISGMKDAWFVGYTPGVVGAVWLGYTDTSQDKYLTTTGGRYPAQLFREVLTRALEGVPAESFQAPAGYQASYGETKYINGTPPRNEDVQTDDDEREHETDEDPEREDAHLDDEDEQQEDDLIDEDQEREDDDSGDEGQQDSEVDDQDQQVGNDSGNDDDSGSTSDEAGLGDDGGEDEGDRNDHNDRDGDDRHRGMDDDIADDSMNEREGRHEDDGERAS